MTEIAGKAAVVTGGGSGIGMGIAKVAAREGASVVIADIMLENAQKVAEEIKAEGGKAVAVHCDVCDRGSIKQMKAAANAAFGTIQLLFANAGATNFDPLVELTDDDMDWIIQVNLGGVMNTTRAFLPDMIATGDSHIIATSSGAGLAPGWIPVHVVYSAAKMGIIGMTMNLALELEQYGVRTTAYCPGGFASGMKENNARYRPARFGGPGEGEVHVPSESFGKNPINMYPPENAGRMVMRAVRNNRPLVFDHANQRQYYQATYADPVDACWDDIEAWEREFGIPETLGVTR